MGFSGHKKVNGATVEADYTAQRLSNRLHGAMVKQLLTGLIRRAP